MEYKCKTCNRQYSSYQSLWIHTKKFHSIKHNKSSKISSIQNVSDTQNKKHVCKDCSRGFSRIDNLKN